MNQLESSNKNARNVAIDGSRDREHSHREIWPVPPVPFNSNNGIDERALDELVEFYVRAKVDGLFILALSGEAFELTSGEHEAICRQVIKQVAGRIPLVVAGNFAGDLSNQIQQLQRIAAFGTNATVVFLSKLPRASHVVDDLLQIADKVEGPLGVYECPVPEHRLLSATDVANLAQTGRFVFMKETSRKRDTYQAKLLAAQGSPLKIYQANWAQLPYSLDDGSPGFCGIIANMFPELVAAFCNRHSLSAGARRTLHAILADALSCITRRHYPATMKYVLRRRGLAIDTYARVAGAQNVDDEDVQRLEVMLHDLQLLQIPTETLAAISERTLEMPHDALKGPHRTAQWAHRSAAVPSLPDID